MANTLRIKRRDSGGAPGAPTTLENAELAYNEADNTLYYGFGTGGAGGSATTIVPIAGPGAFITNTTTQTVTGNKDFSGNIDFSGSVDFNNLNLLNIADPTLDTHAANKRYVDAAVQGLDIKDSVVAASTANIANLSSVTVIDNVTLADGDRVLLKDQTDKSENGIYEFTLGTTSLARADDANTNAKVTSGMFTFITSGDTHANQGFVLQTDDPITLGTTDLDFSQFSGAGSLDAGDGLIRTGNTISAATASSSRIVVNADNIDLATTGVSASTYKSVTVDLYGRITAGSNPTTLAGFGITDAVPNVRTITTTNGLTGGGNLSANRTFSLTGQALALHNLSANGIIVRTSSGNVSARTITGTSNRVTVTNGDGVSGNPTVDISSSYVGQNTITTVGTIATGTWQGDEIGLPYGGTGRDLSSDSDGSIYKKSGSELIVATAGTDYLNNQSTINGGTF